MPLGGQAQQARGVENRNSQTTSTQLSSSDTVLRSGAIIHYLIGKRVYKECTHCQIICVSSFCDPCPFFPAPLWQGNFAYAPVITRKQKTCMAPTCCRLSFEMEGWLPWELVIYGDGDSLVGSAPCSALFTGTCLSTIYILLLGRYLQCSCASMTE